MNTGKLNKNTRLLNIIKNGEKQQVRISNWEEWMIDLNQLHLYGERAIKNGEAPIKAVVNFVDGNVQGLRGDKYNAKVKDMCASLMRTIQGYLINKKISKVVMYDNRQSYSHDRVILLWEAGRGGAIINFLEMYVENYKIK